MGINTHIRCWASYACTTTPDHGWAAWVVRRARPGDMTLPHPRSVPTRRHDIRIPGLPGQAHAGGGRGGEALVGRRLPAAAAGVPSWGKAGETTPRQSRRRRAQGRLRCDIDHITGRLPGRERTRGLRPGGGGGRGHPGRRTQGVRARCAPPWCPITKPRDWAFRCIRRRPVPPCAAGLSAGVRAGRGPPDRNLTFLSYWLTRNVGVT